MASLEEAAVGLVGRFQGCGGGMEAAAWADLYEVRAVMEYIGKASGVGLGFTTERCLFTFLTVLRMESDYSIPAPEPLRGFAARLKQTQDPFPGVGDDEDAWEPLQDAWREFNKGKVCPRTSYLRQPVLMRRPRKPARKPLPLLIEAAGKDDLPCGWDCSNKCSSSPCRAILNGAGFADDCIRDQPDCSCDKGMAEDGCWTIFDLVDRLVHQDECLRLPVHNLGWNLRAVARGPTAQLLIDGAYSTARVTRPDYSMVECATVVPFRVGEARRLIQGLKRSPYLRALLLHKPPPLSILPLHFWLQEAAAHARCWLFRADLPVHYNGALKYADICTVAEAGMLRGALSVLSAERGPSLLEQALRHLTIALYWLPWAENGITGIRVLNMRPQDYDVFWSNATLWNALTRLAYPVEVSPAADAHNVIGDPVGAVFWFYNRYHGSETAEKKRFLFPAGGEPEFPDPWIVFPAGGEPEFPDPWIVYPAPWTTKIFPPPPPPPPPSRLIKTKT